MSHPRRLAAGLCLLLTALALQVLAPTAATTAAAAGSLSVSPRTYVGGQLLTFAGNLGRPRVKIRLQSLAVNRPGAEWYPVPGSAHRTDAQGRFSFTHPAPSMFNKRYRVVGGGRATDGVLLKAKSQDLVLYPDPAVPAPGSAFKIRVDTQPGPHHDKSSPSFLSHRQDLPAPVFPGRTLTLQQRVGDGWQFVAETTTDGRGQGVFEMAGGSAGTVVYRVRQERYPQAGGPPIGWFPSFPTQITIGSGGAARRAEAERTPSRTRTASGTSVAARGGHANTTAAKRFRWGAAQYDFAWELGEDLDSPPYRGRVRRGSWVESSTGLGRVGKHNGGLNLESSRTHAGPGDRGTTAVTMQGNPAKFGRWEVRVRVGSVEKNARDYASLVELVPADRPYCANQSITVADVRAHSARMRFGVRSDARNRSWSRSRRIGGVNNRPLALGVEVSRKRVAFFHDGRLIGVAPRAAVPRVPLTLRLSLVGQGQSEMNSTEAKYDWMRGYTLKSGRTVTRGPRMRSRGLAAGC